jgi:biopolymer transport protein ExbB
LREVTVGDGGTFASWFETGGITMWLLAVLAAVGLAVATERVVALARAGIDINDFLGQVRKALVTNRSPREAIKICEQFRGPAPSIVKAGLLKYGQPRDDVEKTLENAALFETGRLERFLPLLATLAGVAPLLGFLGTVTGVIRALDASAASGAPEFAEVARAIPGPLVATVAGLSIGILLRLLHGWLTSRASRVERDIAIASNMLLETFGEMGRVDVHGPGVGESSGAVPTR